MDLSFLIPQPGLTAPWRRDQADGQKTYLGLPTHFFLLIPHLRLTGRRSTSLGGIWEGRPKPRSREWKSAWTDRHTETSSRLAEQHTCCCSSCLIRTSLFLGAAIKEDIYLFSQMLPKFLSAGPSTKPLGPFVGPLSNQQVQSTQVQSEETRLRGLSTWSSQRGGHGHRFY